MKTIQWLEQLAEPYRSQAIKNCRNIIEVSSVGWALYGAFNWIKTPEGGRYWNDIYNDILENQKTSIYLQKNQPMSQIKEGDKVYYSDTSKEGAILDGGIGTFIKEWKEQFIIENSSGIINYYSYIVPVPPKKTITIEVTEEQEEKIKEMLK